MISHHFCPFFTFCILTYESKIYPPVLKTTVTLTLDVINFFSSLEMFAFFFEHTRDLHSRLFMSYLGILLFQFSDIIDDVVEGIIFKILLFSLDQICIIDDRSSDPKFLYVCTPPILRYSRHPCLWMSSHFLPVLTAFSWHIRMEIWQIKTRIHNNIVRWTVSTCSVFVMKSFFISMEIDCNLLNIHLTDNSKTKKCHRSIDERWNQCKQLIINWSWSDTSKLDNITSN